jgi:hypothetical protein
MGADGIINVFADNILVYVQILEALVTTAAVIAGGWWFFARRENVRKANISHDVMFAEAGNQVYVGVRVTIRNTGRRRIESDGVEPKPVVTSVAELGNVVILEELSPFLGETEVSSQELSPEFNLRFLGLRNLPGTIVIEPDEEQSILLDFLIPKTTKTIKVYSHIDNTYNNSNGWNTSTIHHVTLDESENKPKKKGAKP